MAKATTKKVVKKAVASPRKNTNAARLLEERHIGYETTDWTNPRNMDAKVMETLRHYNYFYDVADGVKWAKEWIKQNRPKNDLKYFSMAEDWRVSMTLGGLCKMMLNGASFEEKRMTWINNKIQEVIDHAKNIEKQKKKAKEEVKIERKSAADIVKDKTHDFIAELEDRLDHWTEQEEEFSVYEELKKVDAAYNTAKAVYDYYKPLVEELEELTTKKTDDLVEAYTKSLGGIRMQKRYLAFVKKFIADAEMFMNSKKAVRKPRAKKTVTASQQIAKVVYQKESSEFKITSIEPSNIVGASMVVLFNTKTRDVTILNSSSGNGFTVKGTTIQDIDIENSQRKKVRKPEPFLAEATKSTKARLKRVFEELKTKPAEANGRLNSDTIILKAYK